MHLSSDDIMRQIEASATLSRTEKEHMRAMLAARTRSLDYIEQRVEKRSSAAEDEGQGGALCRHIGGRE